MALVVKAAAALMAVACVALPASKPPIIQLAPSVFRAQVRAAVMPAYPSQSVQAGHSGVAAADVHVSGAGTVLDVKLLQAPDASVGSEVVKALSKWTFRPALMMPAKTPVEIEGRIILSFSLKGGTPEVTDLVAEHIRLASVRK